MSTARRHLTSVLRGLGIGVLCALTSKCALQSAPATSAGDAGRAPWLAQTEGTAGGGFFATHPATADRIEALRNVR